MLLRPNNSIFFALALVARATEKLQVFGIIRAAVNHGPNVVDFKLSASATAGASVFLQDAKALDVVDSKCASVFSLSSVPVLDVNHLPLAPCLGISRETAVADCVGLVPVLGSPFERGLAVPGGVFGSADPRPRRLPARSGGVVSAITCHVALYANPVRDKSSVVPMRAGRSGRVMNLAARSGSHSIRVLWSLCLILQCGRDGACRAPAAADVSFRYMPVLAGFAGFVKSVVTSFSHLLPPLCVDDFYRSAVCMKGQPL